MKRKSFSMKGTCEEEAEDGSKGREALFGTIVFLSAVFGDRGRSLMAKFQKYLRLVNSRDASIQFLISLKFD